MGAYHPRVSLPDLAPLVVVLVLLELAAGALIVTWLGDVIGDAQRGFAGTTTLICLAVLAADLLLLAILPDPAQLLHQPVDAGRFASMIHWSIALAVAMLLYALFCWVGTDIARRVVGAGAVVCAGVALARAAATFGSPLVGGYAGALAILPAALLAGSTLAGMLLGHWYLIAPDLSFRPLRRAVALIFVAVAVEVATMVVGLAGADPAARHTVLTDPSFWLLVVGSGVVVTGAVNGLTYYFARIRANQPATAMLYALIISALMGLVPSHLLYFITRVPV